MTKLDISVLLNAAVSSSVKIYSMMKNTLKYRFPSREFLSQQILMPHVGAFEIYNLSEVGRSFKGLYLSPRYGDPHNRTQFLDCFS